MLNSIGSVLISNESDVVWCCVVASSMHSFRRGSSDPKSNNASLTSSSRHFEYKNLGSGCSLYVDSWYGKYMVKCQKQTKIKRLPKKIQQQQQQNKRDRKREGAEPYTNQTLLGFICYLCYICISDACADFVWL